MNRKSNFARWKGLPLSLALVALVPLFQVRADDPTVTTTVTSPDVASAAAGQEEVRDGAKKVNSDLQAIVDDMKQNGLSDAQIAKLLQTSGKLDSLNEQDMQKIIDLFKSVSAMPQPNDQQTALLTAYEQQKSVSTQLKELALELAQQASIQAVIHQLESLVMRQSENIRQTERLQKIEGQTLVRYDVQKRLMSRIADEQTAIAQDTTILGEVLTAAQQPQTDSSTPQNSPDAEELQRTAGMAALQTSNGPLYAALSNQTQLKDKLLQTLAAWKAKQDMETRLQQAQAQVAGLLKDQANVAAITDHSYRGNDGLAERQAKVADHAELAQDIAKLNPEAGADMAQAQTQMQQSSDALVPSSNIDTARPAQALATQALSNVSKLLAQQAEAMNTKQDEPLTDRMKDLQALKNEIDQAQQTAQAKLDATLPDQVANLQKEASPLSPEAANELGDAASKLQQADMAGGAGKLGEASKSVQKQMDALAQPAKEYEALAKASDLLKEAVEKSSDANASLKDRAHPDQDRVAGDLNTAQGDLDQLDSTMGAQSPEAHQTIQQAGNELKAGSEASAKGDLPGGQGHVQAGLKILTDAQQKLAQAKANAQQKGMAAVGQVDSRAQRLAQNNNNNQNSNRDTDHDPDNDRNPREPELFADAHNLKATGAAQVVGTLSPQERDALVQSEAEKTPPEYAPMVQQYMKNLSDSSSK